MGTPVQEWTLPMCRAGRTTPAFLVCGQSFGHPLCDLSGTAAVLHCSVQSPFQTLREAIPVKKTTAILSAMALACAISVPAAAQQHDAAKLKRVQMGKEKEEHPEIAGAMMRLKEAKQNLDHAAHDFGGPPLPAP